jgi:hypothetical protein
LNASTIRGLVQAITRNGIFTGAAKDLTNLLGRINAYSVDGYESF